MHATVVKHYASATLPEIRVTIVAGDNIVGIRISDQGTSVISCQYQLKVTAMCRT
jgi:pyruvate dehydrogenase kinase 2/3/4